MQISCESFSIALLSQVELVRQRPQPFLGLHKLRGFEVHGLLQFAAPTLEMFLRSLTFINVECRTNKPDRLSFPVAFIKKRPAYTSDPHLPMVRPHNPVFNVVGTVS